MIVKRIMKTEMQNLKWCKLEEDTNSKDNECSSIQKKRRMNENLSCGSGSRSSEGWNWGGEVHSHGHSNSMELNGASRKTLELASESEWVRPPLLRSSRGRAQMLPSRFSDSVLDTWKSNGRVKKDSKRFGFEDDIALEDIGTGFVKQGKRNKCGSKSSLCFPYSAEMKAETESGGLGFNDFDYKKLKTTVNGSRSLLVKKESNASGLGFDPEGVDLKEKPNGNAKKREGIYKPEDFALGDVVWAKCGKQYPAWPAVVIDPILQAPKSVLNCCVPGAICVMFFGYSKNGKQRDYAWAKQGMIFPFLEFMDRFQRQTQLYKSKPSDFHMAMEEAMLAEDGILDSHLGAEQITDVQAHSSGLTEYAGSYVDQGTISCAGCGLMLPCKTMKKIKDSSFAPQHYCKPCAKLLKSKQYCGICKKIWHHSDGGDWVCCDGCNVWVHAECDKISSKLFKDLEKTDYYCPDCKGKFNCKLSASQTYKSKIKSIENSLKPELPENLAVVCNGMKGIYIPKLHLVMCKCGSCGSRKQTPIEWEGHAGCRAKKWKYSVKVESTMQPLIKWVLQITKHKSQPGIPLRLDQQKVLSFLQEKYEPVYARWTTERCAICRWVEDWEDNKIIICNRCQIAVHQECYGAKNVQFTSWVCRVCETPDVERECCLCPVKGGALKPTDVEMLWVHVTCAWFRPEVLFQNHEAMEPATGILKIPSNSFLK
ncbi:histone-lysine N-methyltransferase ATX3-like, partial [Gastrolobium bilobum]|uniref:histone-lysine N-methyltransferase ATX3-like n=1 Tax=Gastrolobium bilobum TaxID=150636 RepID=UPI002AB12963